MLERQSQLRLHEDDDEESQFILDPSLLTIQDFKARFPWTVTILIVTHKLLFIDQGISAKV